MAQYDDRRDDDSAERPARRRRDDDAPKKKSALPIILIILGVVGLLCVGTCGGIFYWFYSIGVGGQKASEAILAKVGSGDLAGAYNGMSSNYKASKTQVQFESDMKAMKLDEYTSVVWGQPISNSNGQGAVTYPGTANLKSGGTTPVKVTVRLLPDFKTWEIDDIVGGSGPPPSTVKTPTTDGEKKKTGDDKDGK